MTPSSQERRIAFLTGTSSGMGLVTAVELAKEGYHVVASMRDLNKQGGLLDLAEQAGVSSHIEVVQLDVSDDAAVGTVIQQVYDKHGNIDLLINNAGSSENAFTEELDMDAWRRVFETNFFGVVAAVKAVLPRMREQRKGLIINIGSISARLTFPGLTAYSASKAAIGTFSEALRLEMAPFGVHVVLIEPGAFKTGIWEKGIEASKVDPDSPYHFGMERLVNSLKNGSVNSADPLQIAQKIVEITRTEYPEFRFFVPEALKDESLIRFVTPFKRTEKPFIDSWK